MARIAHNWNPEPVATFTVAPHRYQYDGTLRALDEQPAKEMDLCNSFAERKENRPYVPGEVVYLDRGGSAVKALIIDTFTSSRDTYGSVRELYRVLIETKAGHWSKLWEYAYPGFIQRGYQRAGLAPDVDQWEPLNHKGNHHA